VEGIGSAALLLLLISHTVGAHRAHVRSLPPPQPGFSMGAVDHTEIPLAVGWVGMVRDLCRHNQTIHRPELHAPRGQRLIAILLTVSLAGCALYDIRRRESQRARMSRLARAPATSPARTSSPNACRTAISRGCRRRSRGTDIGGRHACCPLPLARAAPVHQPPSRRSVARFRAGSSD
jgi:hypothetical protein